MLKGKVQSLSFCRYIVNEQKHVIIRVIRATMFLGNAESWK